MDILRRDRRRNDAPGRAIVAGLALVAGLGACQKGSVFSDEGSSTSGGYPSLRSVPLEARPSSSIEERRTIVRTLLEERDQSRRQTAVVRSRSGLSVDPPPISASEEASAEDIVPDASVDEDDAFRLTPEGGDDTSPVYRTDSQFDDGGLDDFIRQLKRDTRMPAPLNAPAETEEPAADDPISDAPDEEDVSAISPELKAPAGGWERLEQPLLLAAFAPAITAHYWAERDVTIRLAAAEEEEPGFFCSYLGWALGWSGACLDETGVEPPENGDDDDVAADLEQELRQTPDEEGAGRSEMSRSPSSSEAGRERAERRLSEEDAAEAIEDAGRTALAPVTSSLEKLRDFIRNRRSDDTIPSSPERRRSLRPAEPSTEAAAIDRPPTPLGRPKRRTDITIEDEGERFVFNRTPRPAFKPTPDEPVILKAKGEHRRTPRSIQPPDPPPEPLLRPKDLLVELKGNGVEAEEKGEAGDSLGDYSVSLALTTEAVDSEEARAPATSSIDIAPDLETETLAKVPAATPRISDPLSASKPGSDPEAPALALPKEPAALVIAFEPGTPGLPSGLGPRLAELLNDAKRRDQKIHIIGEASTNHLARRRATDVGAALVQLGATVEILEYDHDAISDVDQVRLVLRAAEPDPLARTAEPAVIEK